MLFQAEIPDATARGTLRELARALIDDDAAWRLVEAELSSADPASPDDIAALLAGLIGDAGLRVEIRSEQPDPDGNDPNLANTKAVVRQAGGSYLHIGDGLRFPGGRDIVAPPQAESCARGSHPVRALIVPRTAETWQAVVSPDADEQERRAARQINDLVSRRGGLFPVSR